MKKLISFLLVLTMVFGMIPMTVSAEDVHTVALKVDTSECATVEAGQTISIPVVATENDGVTLFGLEADFDETYFEKVSGTYTSGDVSITTADNMAFYENADLENNTTTGTLFYINLKVKDSAPSGTTEIGLKVANNNPTQYFYYLDANYDMIPISTQSFTPGTITIAGETVDGLTFTNGTQTWNGDNYSDLVAIMEAGTGLTAPASSGCYFAGFFSGLEADGTYITEENGYYILSAGAIGSGNTQSFANVTEWRPRYDTPTDETTGEYHALWLKNDLSGQAVNASMRVLTAGGITVSVVASDDNTNLKKLALNMLKADFTAVGDNGYVKLLTDVTLSGSLTTITHLDLNGNTLNTSSYIGNSGSEVEASVRSSYGNGSVKRTSSGYVFYLKGTVAVIRDVDLVGYINLYAGCTLKLLENCTLSNTGKCIEVRQNAEISEISHCTITGGQPLYLYASYSSSTDDTKILNIHDTVITQSEDGSDSLIKADTTISDSITHSVRIQLGANTKLESKLNNVLLYNRGYEEGWENSIPGLLTVEFTSTDVTMVSPGGNPLPQAEDYFKYILPDGYAIQQSDGKAELVPGYEVTYMNYEGTEAVALERVVVGNAASLDAYNIYYPLDGSECYKHIGWSIQQYAAESMSSYVPTGDVTLYPVRQSCTAEDVAAVSVTINGATTYYYQWADAAVYMNDNGPGSTVEVDLLSDLTAGYGLGATKNTGVFWIGLYELTLDLNGHTLTFNTPSGWECIMQKGNGYNSPFTIQSTGSQGTIVVPDGAWNFIGGYPFEDGQSITVKDVKIKSGYLENNVLFQAQIKNGGTTTLNLENVEAVAAGNLVGLFADGTGGTFNVNLTDCDFTSTNGRAVNFFDDTVMTDTTVNVNISGENTKLKSGDNSYPISDMVTSTTLPEGYKFTDSDGDGTYTLEALHTCDYTVLKSDETGHWYECECGEKQSEEVTAHVDENKQDHKCDTCGYVMSECADGNSDHNCDVCGTELSQCSGGNATCTQKATCSTCGKEYGELAKHSLTATEAKDATCTEAGNSAYWTCGTCGKYFDDAEGKTEIGNDSWILSQLEHSYTGEWVKTDEGHAKKCVNGCDGTDTVAEHTDSDSNNVCDECQYAMPGAGDGEEEAYVPTIGNGASSATPDENGNVTFKAGTADAAPYITVTAPTDGWKIGENAFTVSSGEDDVACVVLVKKADGSYERRPATTDEKTGVHSFTAELATGDQIVVAVKGDISMDGIIDGVDAARAALYFAKKITLEALNVAVGDLDDDNVITGVDAARAALAFAKKITLTW